MWGGAESYQDEIVFEEHGVKLLYQNFNHPIYTQSKQTEFQVGLSVIDAAMNLGFAGVRELIEK